MTEKRCRNSAKTAGKHRTIASIMWQPEEILEREKFHRNHLKQGRVPMNPALLEFGIP
jgi:hypothetical protein